MKCPCHSQKDYSECCEPFHLGKALPKVPVELMRSRYSAYALSLAKYIMETTSKANPAYMENKKEWEKKILGFYKSTSFLDLIIESSSMDNEHGTVTFHAILKQGSENVSFRETSQFEKVDGKWLYKTGVISR